MKVYILLEGQYSDEHIVKCSLDINKLHNRVEDIIKEDYNKWGYEKETDSYEPDDSRQWLQKIKRQVSFEEFRHDQLARYNIEEYDLV